MRCRHISYAKALNSKAPSKSEIYVSEYAIKGVICKTALKTKVSHSERQIWCTVLRQGSQINLIKFSSYPLNPIITFDDFRQIH